MLAAEYQIGEGDQLSFADLHFTGSVPRFLVFAAVVVAAIAGLSYAFDGTEAALSVSIGGLFGMILMLGLVRYVFVPRHARRAWRDFALIKEPISLTLDDDGFELVQPSAHVKALWRSMIAWDENESVFAIYVTRQQAYILPKGQISPSHINHARERLIDTGLTKRGKGRK